MPIGNPLSSNGFCDEHSDSGHGRRPQQILSQLQPLPKREGSETLGDRHVCPYCASIQGYLDACQALGMSPPQAL